jgi:signal transduction histidine kinase
MLTQAPKQEGRLLPSDAADYTGKAFAPPFRGFVGLRLPRWTASAYARDAIFRTHLAHVGRRQFSPMPRLVATLKAPALPRGDATARARFPLARKAFAGLTLDAVAIIALLLVIRSVSASVDLIVAIKSGREALEFVVDTLHGLQSTTVMAATMVVIILATSNLGPQRGRARGAALVAAVVISSGLGIAARLALAGWFVSAKWEDIRAFSAYVWPRYAIIGALLTIVAELYRRERASLAEAQHAELDAAALERELAAARLQALQAQIEPHFLFNTLANVRRLFDEDPQAGRTMLEMLMCYIHVALPGMRRRESTLEDEAALIEAYLHIHRVRMGARLAFVVDIPRALRSACVPPMMLLTLVENAVKHGLNARPDGGRIHVTARIDDARLALTVADTGVGFGSGSGTGLGLANISARLASEFGERATLLLQNNELGGATASIVLPYDAGTPSA